MKSLKCRIGLLLGLVIGLIGADTSSAQTTYYQSWLEKTNIDPDHDWTIKLNQKLDQATVNGSNIYVFQDNSFIVEGVEVSLNENQTVIKVEAPEEGYAAEEEYVLYIEKSVKSAAGKELKHPIKMKFTIKKSGTPLDKTLTELIT